MSSNHNFSGKPENTAPATVPQEEDNSFKYVMMDTGSLYLGARYSLSELMAEDMVPFKFRAVISHYLLKEMEPATTLESQLYYLEPDSFLFEILRQLRVKVKINIITEKKRIFGKTTRQYREQILTLEQLTGMDLAEKQLRGLIVREMIVSRIGLMTFSV